VAKPKGPQNGRVPAHASTSLYAKSESALRIRAERVRRIVNRVRREMPWLADSDVPALKSWAELEILSATTFAWLTKMNVINSEGEPRRLLAEHRQMKLAALAYAKELGLTPLTRAALKANVSAAAIDLAETVSSRVVEIGEARKTAQAAPAPNQKPIEPIEPNEL
jgi:hypothetical protein